MVPAASANVCGQRIASWVAKTSVAASPLMLATKFFATFAAR
jgi:hypothetical protein